MTKALLLVAGLLATGTPALADCLLQLQIEYRPRPVGEDDPWDLFVYLDGEPVVWLAARGNPWSPRTARSERTLAVGHHTIRLLQERHLPQGLHSGRYRHEARVAPEALTFDVTAAATAQLTIAWHESRWHADRATLRFESTGAAVTTGPLTTTTAAAQLWPRLCDDLRQSRRSRVPSRHQARELERCREWSDLWPAAPRLSWAEVLATLARFEFRPSPADLAASAVR